MATRRAAAGRVALGWTGLRPGWVVGCAGGVNSLATMSCHVGLELQHVIYFRTMTCETYFLRAMRANLKHP